MVVNEGFNRATLYFGDGSRLEFEHTSRKNRWARASARDTTADKLCCSLSQFRLNARHLQLFFVDGSDAEFSMSPNPEKSSGTFPTTGSGSI